MYLSHSKIVWVIMEMMILFFFLKINLIMKMMNSVTLKRILREEVQNLCIKWDFMVNV
jgi:hypothetical protein